MTYVNKYVYQHVFHPNLQFLSQCSNCQISHFALSNKKSQCICYREVQIVSKTFELNVIWSDNPAEPVLRKTFRMMLADQAAKYSTILKEAVFTCESMTITIRQKYISTLCCLTPDC